MRYALVLFAVLAAMMFGGVVGFAAGYLIGGVRAESWHYQSVENAMFTKIRPVLQKSEFARVTAASTSDARVYLVGTVDSEETRGALERQMRFLFGDEEARFMMNTGNLGVSGK
jgi:hypothetical protein